MGSWPPRGSDPAAGLLPGPAPFPGAGRKGSASIRGRLLAQGWGLALAGACALAAQAPPAWPDPGLSLGRDLFPLNLIPLAYRPLRAAPLGPGACRFSFQLEHANTFEFSQPIKDAFEQAPRGRARVDRRLAAAFAQGHPDEPLLYYFDGEVQRAQLDFQWGLASRTDLGVSLAWEGLNGGCLDGLIEAFHGLGFRQTGRDHVVRDNLEMVVIQKGRVTVFSDRPARARPEDPVLTLLHRAHQGGGVTVSLTGTLKLPLTRWAGAYQSGWDSSVGLAVQWLPGAEGSLDLGGAYLRRSLVHGNPAPFFTRDQVAWHLGWEWRRWSRVRPYLTVVGTRNAGASGLRAPLDRAALVHDLGVHVRTGARSALTVAYINNITHGENTADMGLALRWSLIRP
jgi:hypothetical protein